MTFSNTRWAKIGITGAIAGAVMAMTPMSADAAVIYATSAEIVEDGPRGTADDRDNINNAFGAADTKFFELGYDAIVDFQFGTPTGQSFFGPGSIVEITFGNSARWPEAVKVEVGLKADSTSFIVADPNPLTNIAAAGGAAFTFSGVFDTVRLTDLTKSVFPNGAGSSGSTGGFDVDAIGVSPVPLPAGGLLLLGGLGGLVALRRRRKAA